MKFLFVTLKISNIKRIKTKLTTKSISMYKLNKFDARVNIDNSTISKINSQQGSAIDIHSRNINCDNSVSI